MEFISRQLNNLWNTNKDSTITKLVALYGLFKIAKYSYQFFRWFKTYFLRLTTNLKKKYGDGWVVITGATSGIGLAIARSMIQNGMNRLVLISRNLKKLNEVKADLEKMKSSQTLEIEIVEYDFDRNYTETDVAELETKLAKYLPNISILFNNVGTSHMGEFTKSDFFIIKRLVSTNIYSTIFVTQTIIKNMLNRKERSLVVAIGSGSVFIAPRYLHLYVGTKAFMKPFFDSLREEYNDKIDFTYAHVGPVRSNINTEDLDLPFSLDANVFASHLMTKIGRDKETYVNPFNAFFHSMYKSSFIFNHLMRVNVATKFEEKMRKDEMKLKK